MTAPERVYSEEEQAQIAKSELVAEVIRLGVPSYEAWALSEADLSALIAQTEE